MFNAEFFPTPDAVIEKMLAPLFRTRMGYRSSSFFGPGRYDQEEEISEFAYQTVLDPSAGSGAILDYVGKLLDRQAYGGRASDKRLYCFETDATLSATLQGKGYRLLGYDFLKYSGDMHLPLIVMNPPFSCGDLHVLHAYQVVGAGGEVVALVNSETLRNPYTRTRQLLANLIEQTGGSVEELGACFKDSERPTDVEVSIIRLHKPQGADRFSFDWKNEGKEREFDTSRHNTRQVAGRDVIGNMLTQYDCLREQFMALLRAIDGIKHYGAGLTDPAGHRDAWRIVRDVIEEGEKSTSSYRNQYGSFTEQMREQIWQVVLKKVNIQKFMTEAVRDNFNKYAAQNSFLDFTKENVFQLVNMVLGNTGTILEVAVKDLFDEFTQYHQQNRCHVEGWKTNSKFKVNRKLILPNWVEFSEYSNTFDEYSSNRGKYSDVDKVLCYLTGEQYETTRLISHALNEKFRQLGKVHEGTFDNVCYSKFFKIKFFKKGTIHLEFLDEKLHQEFNLRACAGKQWLPDEEQQAYQNRKAGPFAKAKPAPGTEQAAQMGASEQQQQLIQQLLGSGGEPQTETTTLISQLPAEPATGLSEQVQQWAEEAEVVEEFAEAEVVGEVVAEAPPVVAAPKPMPRAATARPRVEPRPVAGIGQQLSFMEMAA